MLRIFFLAASMLVSAVLVAAEGGHIGQTVAVTLRPEAENNLDPVQPLRAHDYGSFVWMEIRVEDLARIHEERTPYKIFRRPFALDLGGAVFDPLFEDSGLPDRWRTPVVEGADLHLVQMTGPVRRRWLDGLENAGLQIVQYIHPHTYVVWGNPEAVSAASRAEEVRWTGTFEPGFRVLPRWRALSANDIEARALIFRGAGFAAVIDRLEVLGCRVSGSKTVGGVWQMVSFRVAGDALGAVAAVPGVYSVQPVPTNGGSRGEMSDQINVNNYGLDNIALPGYRSWLSGAEVDGDGVIIANVDDGVQEDHPDLVSRFIGCVGTTCGGAASSPHGTHTAGIMAADGSSGVADSGGFLRGLGVSPGAFLVEQIWQPFFSQPGGMLLLMEDSLANGASLSGNSWGPSDYPLGYDADTLQVDIGVRDADPVTPGNQSLSYVLSIMNGDGGSSTQGTPDEAKNIFTIGSTKMQYSDLSQIPDINDLSSNTAHGPALDGRLIPHMVAPGFWVDSTVPTDTHGPMRGTSMASPHVSGGVALFIEKRRQAGLADPSPALVKATFLAVAHDLAGNLDADGGILGHPFDAKQGWGRLDLEAVIDPQEPMMSYDEPLVFDNTGEFWGFETSVVDPSRPVRIMLVWTDAPGHGLGGSTPAWNNDLDLEVRYAGATYLGNVFDSGDGWSVAGGTADGMNNTEGVLLGPTAEGSLEIVVRAADVNSDGIPGIGDSNDQDFALVCYNCGSLEIFDDGFESGDTGAWSEAIGLN